MVLDLFYANTKVKLTEIPYRKTQNNIEEREKHSQISVKILNRQNYLWNIRFLLLKKID